MRILHLDLDTLRPDHLGCYGYARDTSPNIDRIARAGVRFSQYYCSDAPCLPSRASLMSGRFGIHTGVVGHGGTAGDMRIEGTERGFRTAHAARCLPGVLRAAGLRTTSISPFAERHSAWWFYAGFNEMINTGEGGMESAERITPVVLDWIDRNAARDDWYLHINYWDPHTPYRAPESFGNPFADDPLPEWITPEVLTAHRAMAGPHCAREIAMYDNSTNEKFPRHPGELSDMADLRRMIDGYDCGIRYMDGHIGTLLSALETQGVPLDDLCVIVSSDHGENMGELGIYGEHATADGITPHIPMIIKWPGAPAGHVDEGLHYNLDLAPTLAELLGGKMREDWDGVSFAPALKGEECGRPFLVLSQCAHVCQRSVRFGDYIYVRTYHDGYHLFEKEMLFDLRADPHEQCDLAARRPELCAYGASLLLSWHDDMMATQPDAVDPLWTVMREGGPLHARGELARYIPYLEKTGRAEAARRLRLKHPQEF